MPDNTKTYKVRANDFEFLFTQEDLDKADVIETAPGEFNVIRGSRSVGVKLISSDAFAKKQEVEVDGEKFLIGIKDPLDQVLDTMGFNNMAARVIKEIKAPMPGLVLDISVEEGQEVKEGDRILILEAMKMENSIVIHADAVIKKIRVTRGQPVEKNQVLVELG
jgi:biotin carboxyl carrier protein